MTTYSGLLDEQVDIFEIMSGAYDALASSEMTATRVETRIRALNVKWGKYQDNHATLWRLKYNAKAEVKAILDNHDYFKNKHHRNCEEMYLTALEKMQAVRDAQDAAAAAANDNANLSLGPHGQQQQSDNHCSGLKLPKWEIPLFDGDPSSWPHFRDMVLNLLVTNPNLTNVQRLYIIKQRLIGDAHKRVKNIGMTGDNFQLVWDGLMEFYDNKRSLVNVAVAMLLDAPVVTRSTVECLEGLYSEVTQAFTMLEALKRPTEGWDDLLVLLVQRKLDRETFLEWEKHLGSSSEPPPWEELRKFLLSRIRMFQSCSNAASCQSSTAASQSSQGAGKARNNASVVKVHQVNVQKTSQQCWLCKGAHYIGHCSQYLGLSVNQRLERLKRLKLCFNCLEQHRREECPTGTNCQHCSAKHHTSVHFQRSKTGVASGGGQQHTNPIAPTLSAQAQTFIPAGNQGTGPTAHTVTHEVSVGASSGLLATALVKVKSVTGELMEGRALIDPCSQVSLASEKFAQQLRVRRSKYVQSVSGVGGASSQAAKGVISLELFSRWERRVCKADAIVLARLTDYVPKAESCRQWSVLEGLELADPEYCSTRGIDLILGVDVYSQVIQPGLRRESSAQPIAQQTSFGWIISGKIFSEEVLPPSVSTFHVSADLELNDLVQKFWTQQEEFLETSVEVSPVDVQCENHFKSTYTREKSGRYVVRLPFKTSPSQLGNSRGLALRMLNRLSARFVSNPELHQRYKDFLKEYEELGHMSRVETEEKPEVVYYLPHHPVIRESSLTTKLRVVFNGSAKTTNGCSLNDLLHEGPKLQAEIFNVITRWRQHKFVYSGDVTKMFRQILINPEDRDFQRILWKEDSGEVVEYRLNTVTYGTRAAPYLAIRVLQQLAEDEGVEYPQVKEVILKTTYMDDVYGGAATEEECKRQIGEINKVFASGGMPLQKWTSNKAELLQDIAGTVSGSSTLLIDAQEPHRTLGLNWNAVEDVFFYSPKNHVEGDVLTKRIVLSRVAQLYDPLGWVAPFVVKGKLLVQELWKLKVGWDEQLPMDLVNRWKLFAQEIQELKKVRVPRHFKSDGTGVQLELHGFGDASGVAYGAVIYLRSMDADGRVEVTLVSSKSKLSPIKDRKSAVKVTIPRLELMASVLLARHVRTVCKTLDLERIGVHLWTDSSVALTWIKSDANKYKQFVKNRVLEVQRLMPQASWRHVPGEDNPADLVSRGVSSKKLADSQLWWKGPSWLASGQASWPEQKFAVDEVENLELKNVAVHAAVMSLKYQPWELLDQYGSLKKLLVVTAWCRRVFLVKKEKQSKFGNLFLQPREIEEARIFWIREIQAEYFAEDLKRLKDSKVVTRRSPLFRLVPFLDSEGLVRLTGRLHKSSLEEDFKHPVILPSSSKFTQLVLLQVHLDTLHGGVQLMQATLRRKYWIIGGRRPVKDLIFRCVTCTRFRGTLARQLMGQLPLRRITPARAFLHCGVDYAGPLTLINWRHRGAKTYKGFLVVFVCFTTSAVHLELATDCSTEGFLAAYKRFTARRGICETMTSDQGTNLVGADRELRDLFDATKKEGHNVAHSVAKDGTKWIFNPPGAPHQGGKWEAAVKSVKFHLKRIIGDSKLTYEELSTLLTQIEAILNSRPLCEIPDDPDEFSVLTPGHFLIGSALSTVPEPSLEHLSMSRLSRYQLIRRMVEKFWEQWSSEYIQKLQGINKWHRVESNLKLGSLVLVVDERLPPTKWSMGRVTQLHPGKDGLCRVVTVRTASSSFKRPIVKICPLPVEIAPAEATSN